MKQMREEGGNGVVPGIEMDVNKGRGIPLFWVETDVDEGKGGRSPPAGVETGVNKGEVGHKEEDPPLLV